MIILTDWVTDKTIVVNEAHIISIKSAPSDDGAIVNLSCGSFERVKQKPTEILIQLNHGGGTVITEQKYFEDLSSTAALIDAFKPVVKERTDV